MRNGFFGMLSSDLGVILFAVRDGFFQCFNAGRYVGFGFAAGDAFGFLGVFERIFGMIDQLRRMPGLTVGQCMFGVFQRFGGMFLGKSAGACK